MRMSAHPLAHRAAENVVINVVDFESWAQSWVFDAKYRQFSPNTIKKHKNVHQKVLWYAKENDASQIDINFLRGFLSYLSEGAHRWGNADHEGCQRPAARSTVITYYNTLSAFFNWCIRQGYINGSPMKNLSRPLRSKRKIMPFVDGFMDRMKSYAQQYPEDYCFDEAATWEVRKDKTKEDFAEHYAIDEIDAAMKYENKAPEAVGAFIRDPNRVQACVDSSREPAAIVTRKSTFVQNPTTGIKQQYVALEVSDIKSNMDKVYFIHGDPGHVDASFAVCLMHIETSSAVTRGHDNIPDDDYTGDVVEIEGHPYEGATIVYFDTKNEQVIRVKTDKRGRHSAWLPQGEYSYGIYDRQGNLIRHETNLHVKAGMEVATGVREVFSEEGGDPSFEEIPQKRIIYPVVEDLILEWRPRPKVPVDYNNVEKVLLQLCRNFNVQQVSFDKFNSVHLIQNLEAAGINAVDMSFSQRQQFGIFSNLRMLINEGLISFLDGDKDSAAGRATRQIKRLRNVKNIKIEPPGGEWKDLADARATAAYFAGTYDIDLLPLEDGEFHPEDFVFSMG